MDAEKTVLNILTGRWIDPNGKLFQKLIHEGYKYADRLLDYLEDIGTDYICWQIRIGPFSRLLSPSFNSASIYFSE
jgi:hypothetical protein